MTPSSLSPFSLQLYMKRRFIIGIQRVYFIRPIHFRICLQGKLDATKRFFEIQISIWKSTFLLIFNNNLYNFDIPISSRLFVLVKIVTHVAKNNS